MKRAFFWIAVVSFGSGLPFGIMKDLVPIWLRDEGISNTQIGVIGGLSLAWSLKVFWSPLVDRFGDRRHWIAASLLGCAASMAFAAYIDVSAYAAVAFTLGCFAVAAATQDIGVDAYIVDLVEKGEEGGASAVRATAWRVAALVAGVLAVAVAAWFGWSAALLVMATIFLVLAAAVLLAPPWRSAEKQTLSRMFSGLLAWLKQPGIATLAVFILIYKLPDAAMGPMVKTYWVDTVQDLKAIGMGVGFLSIAATIVGSIAGGVFVSRAGILQSLFWLGLAQSLSNFAYSISDWTGRAKPGVFAAAGIESFCAGLSAAAMVALLMRVCEKERAAVEYALLSSLFAGTRELAGMVSGMSVDTIGYGWWFGLTAFLAIPGVVLLFSRSIAVVAGEPPLFRRTIQEGRS